jgi:hypothetical protein
MKQWDLDPGTRTTCNDLHWQQTKKKIQSILRNKWTEITKDRDEKEEHAVRGKRDSNMMDRYDGRSRPLFTPTTEKRRRIRG